MKTKIYLNDWSINAGIIGFLKILNHSNKKVTKASNYIEIETEDLRDFHICYFKYFFDKYNVANKLDSRMKTDFENLKSLLKEENQDSKIKQRYKTIKDYLKQNIKSNLDKVKKIDVDLYEKMNASFKELDTIKTIEDIEKFDEIYSTLIKGFRREDINKRITLNSFKSFLSNNYFGQQSFLNVVKTALSYEEQLELMYKDYITDIVESGFLQDILNNKYTVEEIKNYVENININKISDRVSKIYNKIQKNYIDKGKDIEQIKQYLNKDVFKTCSVCEEKHFLSTTYTEGYFQPLALSSNNARNYFWNMNVDFPICDLCKLMLFCAPAGISNIIKIEKDVNEYKERSILCFVNYDTSVEMLETINENLALNSKKEHVEYNPYGDLILDIVKQEAKISNWQLQNVFVVEIDAEYRGFSRLQYFNIQKYVAKFLINYNTISSIKDYKYRLQLMDYILNNKDFSQVVTMRLREELTKDNSKGFGLNSFLATKSRLILNMLKKEESEMIKEEIDKNNRKINVLYNIGIEIHEELKRKGEENKIDGYVHQLLNSVKVKNKNNFMHLVIKLHIMMGKDVSPIFLESMKDSILDFETIGNSFISGLISNRYEKQDIATEQ